VSSPDGAPTGRIVAGIDGSPPSIGALEWAARQAELTGATLEVVMSWEWPTNYGWLPPWPEDWQPADAVTTVVEQAVSEVHKSHPGVEVVGTVREGHPTEVLIEASKEADLLVLGSRGHGEFVGMLIGSVSEHCAAKAHCPVLIHHHE
jgi:nucleotide-binding universal stress UspA family protein